MASADLNSGPHICVADTLLTTLALFYRFVAKTEISRQCRVNYKAAVDIELPHSDDVLLRYLDEGLERGLSG